MGPVNPAIVIFTTAAAATAARIAAATGGRVHACGPDGEGAGELLPALFASRIPIIGVCAAGILIRLLAPHLFDKHSEPPVIAVSPDGQHVVPLLGGHHGANALAVKIADALGAVPALTSASEGRFSRALDDPPPGYVLANPGDAKSAMARALDGQALHLIGEAPWLAQAGYPVTAQGQVSVVISEKEAARADLVYRPQTLVAGMGCERGAEPEEAIALLTKCLAEAGLSAKSLAAIATIDLKADEPALHAVASHFKVPLRLFSASELAAEAARLPNPSVIVEAETGTPGVAEAAAIKAGELLVAKTKSRRVTCAIGRGWLPVNSQQFGRAPGVLHIVGIGPGEPCQRTASAVASLIEATDWVGYGLYLDLIKDLQSGHIEHRFPLGDEERRVRHALELAARGKTVALVCSGDAQIYAMAALVYELLDAPGERAVSDDARRIAIESHPGISAFQMASARAGALIGHDFCCISLSDLLTPRQDIIKRLKAAAKADFVVALYNPRSQRRTELLDEAKQILLGKRPAATPVVLASNLGRPAESVRVTTLAAFDPRQVDMLTIVLIGSSMSRAFKRGDGKLVSFTPRGYEKKGALP